MRGFCFCLITVMTIMTTTRIPVAARLSDPGRGQGHDNKTDPPCSLKLFGLFVAHYGFSIPARAPFVVTLKKNFISEWDVRTVRTLDAGVKPNEMKADATGGSLIQPSISKRPSPPWQEVFSIKPLSDTRGRVPPARLLSHSGLRCAVT
ncbi:hypothetical protein EDB86DRAFT_830429 [Lactarius hatsudake]|nr:hypothetical protein EDB86DRAFT_830429 [Lactarius hatsudake]